MNLNAFNQKLKFRRALYTPGICHFYMTNEIIKKMKNTKTYKIELSDKSNLSGICRKTENTKRFICFEVAKNKYKWIDSLTIVNYSEAH